MLLTTASFLCGLVFATSAHAFAGESYQLVGSEEHPDGNPWHHYDISRRAAAGDACFVADPSQRLSGTCTAHVGGDKYAAGVQKERYLGAGFSSDAALAIAWHADWLDSYLYNPLFWVAGLAQGNVMRGRDAVAIRGDLEALHFDDLFKSEAVQDVMHRYLAGTLIGLHWVAEQPRSPEALQLGFNLVGVSLHAVQDFYSHSTWLNDPARRRKTWFSYRKTTRPLDRLHTGGYESPAASRVAEHGKIALACSVYGRPRLQTLLNVVCGVNSPAQNIGVCDDFRACKSARQTRTRASVAGLGVIPDNGLLFLEPIGINLDSSILASFGAFKRQLTRGGRLRSLESQGWVEPQHCPSIINHKLTNGSYLGCEPGAGDAARIFATAKDLATRASIEWLRILEAQMGRTPDTRALWQAMKQYKTPSDKPAAHELRLRTQPYEDQSRVPFQFLSAGPYPVLEAGQSDGYFLRLEVDTADVRKAGTDAAMTVTANGRSFELDYMPSSKCETRGGVPECSSQGVPAGRIVRRPFQLDDFEKGSSAAYTLGPFRTPPRDIELSPVSASAKETREAFGKEAKAWFQDLGRTLATGIKAIAGANPDPIGQPMTEVLWFDDLNRSQTHHVSFLLNRGNRDHHGMYRLTVRVDREGACADSAETCRFNLTFESVQCLARSSRDHGSSSDEPFFLASLGSLTHEQPVEAVSTPLFEGVVRGTRRDVDITFRTATVPRYGALALTVVGYEGDYATRLPRGRRRANREIEQFRAALAAGIEPYLSRRRGTFMDAVGSRTAADWTVERLRVYGFERSPRAIRAGYIGEQSTRRSVPANSSLRIPLNWGRAPRLNVTAVEDLKADKTQTTVSLLPPEQTRLLRDKRLEKALPTPRRPGSALPLPKLKP